MNPTEGGRCRITSPGRGPWPSRSQTSLTFTRSRVPNPQDDAFGLSHAYEGAYRARLNANLAFWDGLDGKTHWPAGKDGAHPLTELMLADYLVVDVTKPYAEQGSFLEIELAARRREAHQTCGGQALNDDVMDTRPTTDRRGD